MNARPSRIQIRNSRFYVSSRTKRRLLLVAYRAEPVQHPDGGWLVAFAAIEKRSDNASTLRKHVQRLRNTGNAGRGVEYLIFDTITGEEMDWTGQPKMSVKELADNLGIATPVAADEPKLAVEQDTDLGGEFVRVPDALGAGVDTKIYRERGIVSIVLVDSTSGQPTGPSAELNIEDVAAAVKLLGIVGR